MTRGGALCEAFLCHFFPNNTPVDSRPWTWTCFSREGGLTPTVSLDSEGRNIHKVTVITRGNVGTCSPRDCKWKLFWGQRSHLHSPLLRQASTRRLHSASRCCRLAFWKLSICSLSPPFCLRVLGTIRHYRVLPCTPLDLYSVPEIVSLGKAFWIWRLHPKAAQTFFALI